MTRADAIKQLKDLRQEAISRACPHSRLVIQEYADTSTAADDVVSLTMAIKALEAEESARPHVSWVDLALLLISLTAIVAGLAMRVF